MDGSQSGAILAGQSVYMKGAGAWHSRHRSWAERKGHEHQPDPTYHEPMGSPEPDHLDTTGLTCMVGFYFSP
jgi:hypothetical protein